MKKIKCFSILLLLMTVLIMSGCSKEDKFVPGSWNNHTFENSWLNMKFELDDRWYIATDEEIANVMGLGAEIIGELNDIDSEAYKKIADLKLIYGFMVYDDYINNIQLMYENLALTLGGTKYSESDYLDSVKKQLPTDVYTVVGEGEAEIAGKTFKTLELSVEGTPTKQKYLCYKLDKYMVTLVLTYTAETEQDIEAFLNNITTLN